MAGNPERPEDFVLKLRQLELLQEQGRSTAEAVRQIGVAVQANFRWRMELATPAIGARTMANAGRTAISLSGSMIWRQKIAEEATPDGRPARKTFMKFGSGSF
ncbi:hypothetical protein [Roseovarius sp. Pro17]|uniref:hypothetical protein n=1 Tax=Roseovarius sp. Pro17 TaxID=3108175 RepID=UPI002D789191|nr:hypothetical protein [Roseovarius sp. Pro17]